MEVGNSNNSSNSNSAMSRAMVCGTGKPTTVVSLGYLSPLHARSHGEDEQRNRRERVGRLTE